jgi:hypothetical protein
MGREKERGLLAARLRTSKRLRSKPDSKRLNSGLSITAYIDGRVAWRRVAQTLRGKTKCAKERQVCQKSRGPGTDYVVS